MKMMNKMVAACMLTFALSSFNIFAAPEQEFIKWDAQQENKNIPEKVTGKDKVVFDRSGETKNMSLKDDNCKKCDDKQLKHKHHGKHKKHKRHHRHHAPCECQCKCQNNNSK